MPGTVQKRTHGAHGHVTELMQAVRARCRPELLGIFHGGKSAGGSTINGGIIPFKSIIIVTNLGKNWVKQCHKLPMTGNGKHIPIAGENPLIRKTYVHGYQWWIYSHPNGPFYIFYALPCLITKGIHGSIMVKPLAFTSVLGWTDSGRSSRIPQSFCVLKHGACREGTLCWPKWSYWWC